ncbi:GNAT family N-acetyltransferase [Jannaschia rubra]|uniref:Putative acetyltransferase n=2 Tax=Jannaschia rubra TaxID=282197 RepID=A0A0M6XY64_9RHOB|nr:GNAT family N-acetyltransferase [Jannaschia rubra]CTQ34864.1 putative acetyltransferase [Jannaschia rubra]SFG67134.1 Ribosomal protein S18 acetylase RimI [Jannaschia rubra]
MQTSLMIRPIQKDDEEQWRRLWTGYLAYYETEVPEDVYATTFARLLGDDPTQPYGLIAEADGRGVGLVHYLFHAHCWRIERVCYLQDLYVDPTLRGTGVGRQLIEAVYAAADEARAPNVYWLTQHHNEAGRRLYDRVGTETPFIRYNRPSG